ncbi:MAG: hypothetical protein AAGC60_22405 [Acidobacteriota bacterium]
MQTLLRLAAVGRLVLGFAVASALAVAASASAEALPVSADGVPPADDCWDHIGARVVPECVNSAGNATACSSSSIRLWSDVFEPVDSGALPVQRDSTQWVGDWRRPETVHGMEHFNWIEIIGDTAYIAFVSGFSIWDLDCDLELESCPRRLSVREILSGHWAFTDFAGAELYLLTASLDAIEASDGRRYVAVNGHTGRVGLSLWEVTDPWAPRQIYQDYDRDGQFVKLAEIDGAVYALYAATEGSPSGGVHLYNVSRAAHVGAAAPCVENTFDADINCPGVWRGSIGAYPSTRRIDVVQRAGRTYVAHAGAYVFEGVELLEIVDPEAAAATSLWRHDVPGQLAQGVALFEVSGRLYLAVSIDAELRLYDIDSCAQTGTACPSIGAPVWREQTLADGEDIPLTFTESRAEGRTTPFLYIGGIQRCNRGTRHEGLYDLSSLATHPERIYEVTEGIAQGGESYIDPHHGGPVDYWGHYYSRNTHGLNNIGPRTGQFYGSYFLRMGSLLFDKHRFTLPGPVFADGFESGNLSAWSDD